MMLKVLANIINRNPEALVFGSNTVFFYDLLPYLASHVKIIDLTHSITAKQDWLEVKSLRSVDRYYKRIVLGNSALDEFKKIYLAHQIPLSYAEHFQIIKNKVDIPAQLPVKDCSGDLEILFVARNSPEKRAGLFFEIVRRCKKQNVKANFTIIGEFQEVRRGDYLKEPDLGGIADLPYFERGIAFMKEHLGNPKFYVFSDDISWCREHLPLEQSVFVDWNTGTESYRDMQLISLCKHAIISNSSFSWWGAWLNTNPTKRIIVPKQWIKSLNVSETEGIHPEDWIKF